MSVLADLQAWYASNCDGDWEHTFVIEVSTLDNPGWMLTVDLEGTNLEEKPFPKIEESASETDWLTCWVGDLQFHGAGDPGKLERMTAIFIDWAKSQNKDWLRPPEPRTDEQRLRDEDEALFASLEGEIEGEQCRHESCARERIRHSVMCREHHFEMVTGRPVPRRAG